MNRQSIIVTDVQQVYLNSGAADAFYNGQYKSHVTFELPKLVGKESNVLYTTIKVVHAEIPYSFYVVNDYNNRLVISDSSNIYNISLDEGNYNAYTFQSAIQSYLPTGMTLEFSDIDGKFSITHTSPFSISPLTTCAKLLGITNISSPIYSSSNKLHFQAPGNFIATNNIFINIPNIVLSNYNTGSRANTTIIAVPIGEAPFELIRYDNLNGGKHLIKNVSIDVLEIQMMDDSNNLIDFNNVDWSVTLEIERTYRYSHDNRNIDDAINNTHNE